MGELFLELRARALRMEELDGDPVCPFALVAEVASMLRDLDAHARRRPLRERAGLRPMLFPAFFLTFG